MTGLIDGTLMQQKRGADNNSGERVLRQCVVGAAFRLDNVLQNAPEKKGHRYGGQAPKNTSKGVPAARGG